MRNEESNCNGQREKLRRRNGSRTDKEETSEEIVVILIDGIFHF